RLAVRRDGGGDHLAGLVLEQRGLGQRRRAALDRHPESALGVGDTQRDVDDAVAVPGDVLADLGAREDRPGQDDARAAGLDEDALESLREGQHIRNDDRLEALRQFTQRVVAKRGRLEDEDIDVFLAAGFKESNVLDVMLGVAMKTLSNYTNHLAETPLDEKFQDMYWDPSRDMRMRGGGRRRTDQPVPARSGPYSH
ncbi:MAG: hypothetical protein KY410_04160, partial [Proteobacteria bacterium]|nr:hypothetical protein [Pseudomonadota bacterium]